MPRQRPVAMAGKGVLGNELDGTLGDLVDVTEKKHMGITFQRQRPLLARFNKYTHAGLYQIIWMPNQVVVF